MAKDLLSRISGWRNNDCGCNGQTPTQLLIECEDVLTSLAKLARVVKDHDALLNRPGSLDQQEFEKSKENVFLVGLMVGRKFNGQG